jgi:hypothetical protein
LNSDEAERSILFWNNTEVFRLSWDGAEVFKLTRYSESPGTAQKCSRLIYNDAEVFKLTWKDAERSRLSWNDVEVSRLAPERRRRTCTDAPSATRAPDHPRHSDMSGTPDQPRPNG